ncbi:malonyl-CoA synthase [Rhodobacter sp. HX-7-19]|uniref:Malonyl-CoA synthase n=1 Tax=Paragemmobacter kunshanensis TaxID=2583234 RepID=A0A6M1U9B3_9RHOB|nr:malonyl-CoA synthase [Rhodobacter kunshanensis]NGQ93335.1 malonyl-CoA synthase [Rhodobacter kunshanensis]
MANHLFDALFAPLAGRGGDLLILPDGRRLNGAAFLDLVAGMARAMQALGVVKGDRVAVQVSKSPEALACYGAAVALGAVFLPLNTAYTPAEVAYFLGDARPRLFLCDGAKAVAMAPVAAQAGARLVVLNADGTGELADLATAATGDIRAEPCAPGDLAAILYTSGTTGRSKGAMLTHANLLSNAEVLVREWRFTPDDVLLHALPIFHTHGLFVASNVALLSGGAMIWLPGFDAGAVLRMLPAATVMMGVPTFYTRLLEEPGLTRDLVGHMRLFVSGSAPLLAETHEAWAARTGHRILERYGMTETNMNTSNPYEGERRAGTVGFPLPGVELRILAEGRDVPVGEVGMIEVRGPNVFAGYWQMPEKTAEELRADGWFITGDLGMRDGDGYVHIVGRAKDLVITGGYNVYPKEVELVLDEVPGVAESAVIGVPHPDFGEAVFAVLVARKGAGLEAEAVLAAIADRLARFKQPKAAVVVDSLPRNTMGKVQKNLLRDSYRGWFRQGGEI